MRPASESRVSAETLRAAAMALSTRTDGSCRPRSIWLRYGLETWVRSAISRSERLARRRWERMNAPSASRWSCQGSSRATTTTLIVEVGSGLRLGRQDGGHLGGEVALGGEQLGGEVEAVLHLCRG